MHDNESFETVQPQLRMLQIIAAALVAGVIFFAVVTNVIFPWSRATMEISMLPLLGAAALLFSAVLAFVMPAMVTNQRGGFGRDTQARSDEELKSAARQFVTGRIIRMALLEGASFLNLVVYMLDGSKISLFAAGAGLFLLMLSFPTAWAMRGRV